MACRVPTVINPNAGRGYRRWDQHEAPMSYKTILVHCNDRKRITRVLEPAVRLAAAFGAHLIGLSVAPRIWVIPAGMPGSPDTAIIDDRANAYRAQNPAMKEDLEKAAKAQNITAEWREGDAGISTVARVGTWHARTADLVIASQTAMNWQGHGELDIADRLALESGRPLLNGLHPRPTRNGRGLLRDQHRIAGCGSKRHRCNGAGRLAHHPGRKRFDHTEVGRTYFFSRAQRPDTKTKKRRLLTAGKSKYARNSLLMRT
jgi:nucleotide-binding universal stress UspA family protein